MLYNIRVEYRDGSVVKFDRRSRIKPINAYKLNDQIINEYDGWDTIKEVTSIPVYS